MDGNRIRDEGTLSWWMNKEPLRSKPIGLGRGRRAEEIFLNQMDENADNKNADKNGEIILSHETSDFKAYENITRSSRGEANAFISREGVKGESALLGDGFYTKLGFEGDTGTNLTIRFKLNLKAREGSDFIYNHDDFIYNYDDVVILKNKRAITLMQENINVTLKDFIKLILNGGIEEQDLGLIEKMKRKFKRKVFENDEIDEVVLYLMKPNILKSISKKSWILYLLPTMEKSKHFDLFLKKLVKNKKLHNKLLEHFFSQEESVQYEEQLDFIINNLKLKTHLIEDVLSKEHWKSKHYLIDEIIKKGIGHEISAIIEFVLSKEHWKSKHYLIDEIIKKGIEHEISAIVRYVLSKEHWKSKHYLIDEIIKRGRKNEILAIVRYVLSKEHWKSKHYLIDEIIKKGIGHEISAIVRYVLSKEHWRSKHYLIDEIIKKGIGHEISVIIKYVLPNEVNRNWFLQISELKGKYYDYWLVVYVLSQPIWKNNGDLITRFLSNHHKNSIFNNSQRDLIDKIIELLMLPHWREHPNWYSWAEKLIEHKELSNMLSKTFLFEEGSVQYEEQLNFIINNSESKELFIRYFFSRKHWKSKRSLIDLDKIIQEGKTDEIFAIIEYALPNEVNRNWFLQISELKDGYYDYWLVVYVLSQPIWKNNGDLITKILSNDHKNSIFNNSQRDLINKIIKVLMLPHWREHPNWYSWAEKLIENKEFSNRLPEFFLSQEESVQYEEQLNFIINNLESKALLIKYFFSRKHWKSKRSLIDLDKIIQEGKTDEIFAIIEYVLPNEVNRKWFSQISELEDGHYNSSLIERVLSQSIWKNNGDLITELLENHYDKVSIFNSRTSNDRTSINRIEIIELLMLPHWHEHPEWHSWVEKILFPKNSPSWENELQAHFIKIYLHSPHWNRQIDIINRLLDNHSNIKRMAFHLFNLPHMLDHPYLIKKAILKSKHKDHWVSLSKVFKNKGWEKFPEILVMLIQKGIDANNFESNIAEVLKLDYLIDYPKNTVDIIFESNIVRVLKLDHWKNHPDLIAFTGKENFTIQDIYLKSKEQDFLYLKSKELYSASDFLDFQNNRNNRNNKKISSKENGVLYSASGGLARLY